jgi:hypothetical protein
MKRLAIFLLAAVTLMLSAWSLAGNQSTDAAAKPSSFVPHPHTNSHVYGAPIQPAVVGHSNVSHHKHMQNKRSSSPKKKG